MGCTIKCYEVYVGEKLKAECSTFMHCLNSSNSPIRNNSVTTLEIEINVTLLIEVTQYKNQ